MDTLGLIDLPHDVLAHILQVFFRYCDYQTFFNFGVTCSSMFAVASSDAIWSEVVVNFSPSFGAIYSSSIPTPSGGFGNSLQPSSGFSCFSEDSNEARALAMKQLPREKRFLHAMADKHASQVRRLHAKLKTFFV
jgi:hypothetical protein